MIYNKFSRKKDLPILIVIQSVTILYYTFIYFLTFNTYLHLIL
jgi:hypothetical protein